MPHKMHMKTYIISFTIMFILVCLFQFVTPINSFLNRNNRVKAEDGIVVNTTQLGPFDETSGNVNFTVNYKTNVGYTNVVETFMYGNSYSDIGYSSTTAVHSVNANTTYSATWVFPGNQVISAGKRYVKIIIKNRDTNANIYEKGYTIYKPSCIKLNVNTLLKRYWTSSTLGFQIKNNTLKEIIDFYLFPNTLDYLDLDFYYRLDFSSVNFIYTLDNLLYKKAEIIFDDENNVFPNYSKESDGLIHIPMTLFRNEQSFINIKFDRGFYVKPVTLEMSDKKLAGYAATNYFYLPINQLQKLRNYKFTVKIDGFGYNKTNFELTLDFDITRTLLGPCNKSEYCIVGGVSK